jgi:hypothetical protein
LAISFPLIIVALMQFSFSVTPQLLILKRVMITADERRYTYC